MKKVFIVFLFLLGSANVWGQYSHTLYFLENSPYRHTINPAFMPVSKVYVGISPIAYLNLSMRSSLALSDILQKDNGKTITALYDQSSRNKLLKSLRLSGNRFLLDANSNVNLLSFGFRIKEKGYVHLNVSERFDYMVYLPYDLFRLTLDKGMTDFMGVNRFDLSRLGLNGSAYTEIAAGYTHRINEKWSVGGKFKVLLGTVYMGLKTSSMQLETSHSQWELNGTGDLMLAGPFTTLPYYFDRETFDDILDKDNLSKDFTDYLTPKGGGVAFDFGAVYRPLSLLQTSFAVTDLGFIVWNKSARKYDYTVQGKFVGLSNKIDMEEMWNTLGDIGKDILTSKHAKERFRRMIRAKLNVGADLMLVNNKIDIGLYSKTDFLGKFVSEEITLGAAFRPANWFNFALTYSFIGSNWACIGAGMTIMPKDGIQLLMSLDYIPLTYAKTDGATFPYKISNADLSVGLVIVIGSNEKKKKEEAPKMEQEKKKKQRSVKNENEDPHLTQKDRNWKKKKNW